jgi:hypothetical protein
VANNRNKPELGKDYKFFNMDNKEAFLDFGLLTFKIFVFILALQMTGLYDGFNKGFCRTKDGCNIRMPTRQQLCPAA